MHVQSLGYSIWTSIATGSEVLISSIIFYTWHAPSFLILLLFRKSISMQSLYTTLATGGRGFSYEVRRELLSKKNKIMLYLPFILQ